jgi:putative ABC transport system permease protein
VNGRPVGPDDYADDRARRLVDRDFNLSFDSRLPDGNSVVAGRWHGADTAPQFSVEQGLAQTLGLAMGDVLTFEIAGVRSEARITSLRKLDWDSMRVNFFVIAAPACSTASRPATSPASTCPPRRWSLPTGWWRPSPTSR